MKKLMVCSLLMMSFGAGMMMYVLNNKKTAAKATKVVNDAMDLASAKINALK